VAKKVTGKIKLQLPAGTATPAPPVGPALGQHGVNIMQFVKEYNERTQQFRGSVVPVELTVYHDRSFTFELKSPPASDLIKKAAKLSGGSASPGVAVAGSITRDQVREIAQTKLEDLNANDVEAAMKIIEGSARSMGVTISG
jgi:large subunit ribosomal protein L11